MIIYRIDLSNDNVLHLYSVGIEFEPETLLLNIPSEVYHGFQANSRIVNWNLPRPPPFTNMFLSLSTSCKCETSSRSRYNLRINQSWDFDLCLVRLQVGTRCETSI